MLSLIRIVTLSAAIAVVVPGLGIALVSSCSESKRVPTQSYVVRGQVKVIYPQQHELEIHHEAIPDFVDYRGQRVGMMAMVMPFGVDKSLSLESIAVGDKLEFTIVVDWDRNPTAMITKLRTLPADTQLRLER